MLSVLLYDTTLRDGAQSEGISFSVVDKIHIAQKLDELGIHYIEGGWPGSNPKDAEFFKRAKDLLLSPLMQESLQGRSSFGIYDSPSQEDRSIVTF